MKKIESKYGIEITKPWSKEMYDHNEKVAEEMKANLMHHWKLLIAGCINHDKFFMDRRYIMDRDWDEDDLKSECPELVKLQKGVCYSGYGGGYSIQDVQDEFINELNNMQNYQLHEEYSYLSFEGLVRRTKHMMIGFKWEKHDYANICE